jgi:hypothetical protein
MDVRVRGGVFGPGGYGGGIFDGSQMGLGSYEQAAAGVRGLGQENDDFGIVWGEYSMGTQSLQTNVNGELDARGQPLIEEDGILGPETCGAVQYLENEGAPGFIVPGTCEGFQYPRQQTVAVSPEITSAPVIETGITLEPAGPIPTGAARSRAGMMTYGIVGLLLLGGVAMAVASKKKKASA